MAPPHGAAARAQRLNAAIAMCLLALAASLALGRVFSVGSASWKLLAVGVSSALLACAMERRGLLLATICSAAALLVAVGLLVFPDTTLHGLPTLQTLHAIADASRLIGQQARDQVAPTIPLRPLLLAAMTAVWAAIFSCHALAFRAGSPVLALLPPVALVGFADSVLDVGVKPLYALAFLIGALALIFADGLRRVRRWGPVWSGSNRSARVSATAGRGARRVATATMVVAAMAPILVPGFGSKAVFDLSTSSGNKVDIDPLVRVGAMLNQREVQDVFVVTTTEPTYYKMLSLTHFDGDGWTYDSHPGRVGLTQGVVPTVDIQDPAATNSSFFAVSNMLDFTWLATPYPTVHVDVPGASVGYDVRDSALVLSHTLDAGATYISRWVAVKPDPAALQKVVFPPILYGLATDYTQLPPNMQQIKALARQWTSSASNTFDKILAIQNHLKNSGDFSYSATVPRVDGISALENFLFISRKGFCQQFSAAMAAMLRSLGIPARVAVGFAPGHSSTVRNEWQVTTRDAHSWVEVLFPTYGWLTFDPTPSQGAQADSVAPTYWHDPIKIPPHCRKGDKSSKCSSAGNTTTTVLPPATCRRGSCGANAPSAPIVSISLPARRWLTPRKGLVIAALLVLLGFALVPAGRRLLRRIRLRRGGDNRRVILTTYNVFSERVGELGFPRGPGETLEEYRRRLIATAPAAGGNLDQLTQIAVASAYSPAPPDLADALTAKQSAIAAWRDMKKGTALWQRLAGAYRRA